MQAVHVNNIVTYTMNIWMQDSFVLLNETVHTVVVNGLMFCYMLLTIGGQVNAKR